MPEDVAKAIKEYVFHEADRVNYLARSRTDNGIFLAQLLSKPEVGDKLSQYMKKAEVRIYIKDAILNRYSKDKAQDERPKNLEPIILNIMGIKTNLIEQESVNQIMLYKSSKDSCFVVIADGTFLKWETALRKALFFIASKPFSEQKGISVNIILTLFARYQKVSPSDLRNLQKALSLCNAIPFVYGEG